jgi:O-antigen/teichoic acid export membrane protein
MNKFEMIPIIKNNLSLLNSTFSITLIRLIGSICAFGITFLVGKYFGPEILGEYGFTLSVIAIVSLFARFGTDKNIVRKASLLLNKNNNYDLSKLLKSYLLILFLITLIFSLLIIFFGDFVIARARGSEVSNLFFLSGFILVTSSLLAVSSAIFQSDMKYKLSAGYQFAFHPLLFISLLLIFFDNLNDTADFLLLYLISNGICAFVSIFYIYRNYIKIVTTNTKESFFLPGIQFYKESYSLFKAGSASYLLGLTDIILLGIIAEPKYVGIYVLAQRLANSLSIILTPINSYVAPQFARLSGEKDYNGIRQLTRKMIILGSIIAFIMMSVFVLLGKPILSIFGTEFQIGYTILLILAFSQLINALAGPLSQQIMMFDQDSQDTFSKLSLVCLILNLILHLVLIPIMGITGAAITTAFTSIVHNILVYFYMKARLTK